MIPPPTALGLVVCEKVIIEEGSRRLTFVNSFSKLIVPRFPSPPLSFFVFAALTDGVGDATIKVRAERLDTLEAIWVQSRIVQFPDRLIEVQVVFPVNDCSFPAAGRYQITLLADGDWVAQRRLRVEASA